MARDGQSLTPDSPNVRKVHIIFEQELCQEPCQEVIFIFGRITATTLSGQHKLHFALFCSKSAHPLLCIWYHLVGYLLVYHLLVHHLLVHQEPSHFGA